MLFALVFLNVLDFLGTVSKFRRLFYNVETYNMVICDELYNPLAGSIEPYVMQCLLLKTFPSFGNHFYSS
jgi:hypothetical protein